jgi:AraC-like DNA-binding protein
VLSGPCQTGAILLRAIFTHQTAVFDSPLQGPAAFRPLTQGDALGWYDHAPLRETTKPIIEIGMDVGYTSPSHFAHVFRKKTGDQSPRVSGENAGRRARGKFSRIATG